ncbi:hypothetical protein ACL02U_09715 [Streptomyces sp. MS06]|uniref:hypothetical protein n=1 Tax=Streptomyces sp. MS06 TaxID=3385974 RepID=UPI0039A083E3
MNDRITATIEIDAYDLALPDYEDLKARIEEAAAAHKATVTVNGRRYPEPTTMAQPGGEN